MSQQEQELVTKLMENVKDILQEHPDLKAFCTDYNIRRYLINRDWNANKATKMLRDALTWRSTFKPHMIRFDEMEDMFKPGQNYVIRSTDKEGRPVLVWRPRNQVANDNPEKHMRYLIYLIEQAERRAAKTGVHKVTWLFDSPGQKNEMAWPMSVAFKFQSILLNHYPGHLAKFVFYHIHPLMSWFLKVVKPFVPAAAQKVLIFADKGKETAVMDSLFDMSALDAPLGGTLGHDIFDAKAFEADARAYDAEVEAELANAGHSGHQGDVGSTDLVVDLQIGSNTK